MKYKKLPAARILHLRGGSAYYFVKIARTAYRDVIGFYKQKYDESSFRVHIKNK